MASTPVWSAARSGLLGDPGAVDASAQLNQLLGTHPDTVVYQGDAVLTPFGNNFNDPYPASLRVLQYAQPFTMSGTAIGRVSVPVAPVGNGADLIVSLCTNSGGVPGTVITQTRVPASWINQLSAVVGAPGTGGAGAPATFQYTNNTLALAQFNSLHSTANSVVAWPYPSIGTGLASLSVLACYYGNYLIVVGGTLSGNATSGVYTISYDAAGNLSQAIPQQSLPTAQDGTGAVTVSVDPSSGDATIIVTGGATTSGGAATSTVYAASFDPNTGDVASWSTQTPLPAIVNNHKMAAYNGFVYVVSGSGGPGVSYAQVQNGQITAWLTGPPLPVTRPQCYTLAINGFLFAIGGFISGAFTSVYYAPINADGSLGSWQTGPPTPVAVFAEDSTTALQATDYGIIINSNGAYYTLSVTTAGPSIQWFGTNTSNTGVVLGLADSSPGFWQYYGLNYTSYVTTEFIILPQISVPLPATGLTSGSTYHIVLDQVNNGVSNYLETTSDFDTFPGNPSFLQRVKVGGSAWAVNTAGFAIPITIYDQTPGGPAWHTWEDSGARISTLVNATTPDQRLMGLCEATAQPAPILNMAPTFVHGVGPWTATGGTESTSAVHTNFGLPLSGLLTPSGSAAASFLSSEFVPVVQFHIYTMTSYWYSPTGYAHCAVNIGWYDNTNTLISTTSGTVTSVAASTWTPLTVGGLVPGGAVSAVLVNIESSTPAAANVVYIATSTLQDQSSPQVSSVCQIDYDGTWPSGTLYPPVGVTQLA